MNGVEILSSETIYNTFLPAWILVISMVALFMLVILTVYWLCENRRFMAMLGIIASVGCILVATMACCINKNDIHHIEYKVTIDDSVSMNEFLDKYEIIDQEGKIYTVKERE